MADSGTASLGTLIAQPFVPQVIGQAASSAARSATAGSFKDLLSAQMRDTGEVRFSKHAQERMQERGMSIDESGMTRLSDGISKAESKGARDSLMLMDDMAMIVNVPSKTVVTCMDRSSMREQVFTNIDSAVLV